MGHLMFTGSAVYGVVCDYCQSYNFGFNMFILVIYRFVKATLQNEFTP